MPRPLLNLTASDGHAVAVPVALPSAINFTAYVPGLGVRRACMWLTTTDPSAADIREYDAEDCEWPTGEQDDAILEQAEVVLGHITTCLTSPNLTGCYPGSKERQCPVLRAIADMAHAEALAWEAYAQLPDSVRRGMRSVRPEEPETASHPLPSEVALDAYVDVIVEQAQKESEKRAQELAAEAAREQNFNL